MNESLQIKLGNVAPHLERAWIVTFHAEFDTPGGWSNVESSGWGVVSTQEHINDFDTLGKAVTAAREWAIDSGYKPSASKIADYGNLVTIRLRRP